MENLILSLLAPIGLTLFRAGQSQSKNLVKSLTKPFFHLSIGEYQISFRYFLTSFFSSFLKILDKIKIK